MKKVVEISTGSQYKLFIFELKGLNFMNDLVADDGFVDLRKQDSSERTIPVLLGGNLGNPTLKMNLSIKEVVKISRVYNAKTIQDLGLEGTELDAQRPLYEAHAKGLAQYVVIGLVAMLINKMEQAGEDIPPRITAMQKQIGISGYSMLQPIVANIRHCNEDFSDLKPREINETLSNGSRQKLDGVYRITLSGRHTLSIVDGQHRVVAFGEVMKWLRSVTSHRQYPVKGLFHPKDTFHDGPRLHPEMVEFWEKVEDIATSESTVSIECHLGASDEQERQIFADLNSKGKKAELSLALEYDESDPVNLFIKRRLLSQPGGVIEFATPTSDAKDWHKDDGGLLRKELNPITCLVMRGKVSSKGFTPAQVEQRGSLAIKFWGAIQAIPNFGKPGSRGLTVAAQPVVLKGIARLAFDLAFGKVKEQNAEHLGLLWQAIESGELDFSHTNEMWGSLMLDAQSRSNALPGVERYLHVPAGTNLDAGTIDAQHGWVRYGIKHNDIYPRLGDLIRWKLGFEPRASVSRSIAKEAQTK